MKLLQVIIALLFLNSCHLELILSQETRAASLQSISSVGLLVSSYVIDIEKFTEQCNYAYDSSICASNEMLLGLKTVNMQLAASFSSKSTTFAIENEENQAVMITAGHVCNEFDNINETVTSAMSAFVFGAMNEMSLEAVKTISVYDISGNKYRVLNTIYSHPDKPDICLFNIDRPFPATIQLSDELPTLGDRVTNIAVPYGIFGKKTIPIFQGIYSGQKNKHNHVYTISAGPGSSGSPILYNNKLVGIIHSVDRRINQISYATPLNIIRDIIELE